MSDQRTGRTFNGRATRSDKLSPDAKRESKRLAQARWRLKQRNLPVPKTDPADL